jgi:hypothetical protein
MSKMRSAALALAAVFACAGCNSPQPTPTPIPSLASLRAANDYVQLLGGFWVGTPQTGRFVSRSADQGGYVTPTTPENGPQANPWHYAQGVGVLYAEWKLGAVSADAGSRIGSQVKQLRSIFPDSTWSTCGTGGTLYADDDVAWTAWMFTNYVDVTKDTSVLPVAAATINCALNRWAAPDGGLWYNDAKTEESSYAAPLVYAMLRYDDLSGTTTYLARARSLYAWAISTLYRTSDGGFWEGELNGKGIGSASQVEEGNSSTFLAGNMFWSAVAAKLNAISPNASYVNQINATAQFILQHESMNGHFMNDRDPGTDGSGAFAYASDALPLMTSANQSAIKKMFTATAASINPKATNTFFSYSADWEGTLGSTPPPHTGSAYCNNSPVFGCNNLPLFAGDVVWSIVAQQFP